MKLQVYDSDGSIGGGNKLADTLSKAFFGDGEAAAKIALAKAQIAAQQKHADYYGAQTGKTQQETRTAEEQAAANRNLALRAEAEAREKVQRPVPVPSGETKIDVQGDTAGRQVAAPVPVVVQPTPAQMRLYEAQREAEAARARAVAIAGGNAQQVAQGINLQTGGLLLRHHANPTEARVGATLTTGNLPTKDTVVVPGDTAGVDAAGKVAAAAEDNKPHPGPVDPNTGLATYYVRDKTSVSGWRQVTSDGVPAPKTIDTTTPQQTDTRIQAIQRKFADGVPISREEAEVYARDIQRTHQPQDIERQDPVTKEKVKRFDYVLPPGVPHPRDVLAAASAGPVAAPTTAPPAQTQPPAPAVAQQTPVLGETRVTATAPPNVSTTDHGLRARGFTERIAEALPFFGDSVKDGPFTERNVPKDLVSVIASMPTGSATADVLLSQIPNGPTKQYITAALNIIYPILRLESGALISKQEILNMLGTHVPMPNEDQATVEQKLGAMAAAVRSVAIMGYNSKDTPEYKQFEANMAANGFNLNRSFSGRGTGTVFTPGGPVTQPRPTSVLPAIPQQSAVPTPVPTAAAPGRRRSLADIGITQ